MISKLLIVFKRTRSKRTCMLLSRSILHAHGLYFVHHHHHLLLLLLLLLLDPFLLWLLVAALRELQ